MPFIIGLHNDIVRNFVFDGYVGCTMVAWRYERDVLPIIRCDI